MVADEDAFTVVHVGSVFTPGGLRWLSSHFRWLKVVPVLNVGMCFLEFLQQLVKTWEKGTYSQ
ncbi:hypothetical protein TanjilG_17639 [Lupinus angustifolius]|uniref:Uncharacterized protein n=1 Tax=Lupinus angustifolius TaxID=3871 RepID=A0A1J7HKK3_LUPAN|nr:hypothetical protein TanjilG_17639 [Lupinus angustifolius]